MPGTTGLLTTALADRYKIEKHVGEGGMATVYLAHDLKHDRKVALKVLRPELAAVIGAERFLNEIKVTANLQHPHILPLHDSGSADGFLFYVMPFVEDDTLRDKLDREKQLGVEDAVEITRSIASVLDYAHRQGVIHRDIKPANILMHEGQPMIADFGIALAVSEASDQRLTETGLSIGTPHYMSPEQATGDQEPDARSDVYSLGAMLYEMLAGEPPYSGSTAQAILAKVLTSKPSPVRDARDTVPLHVEAAIAKSLHKSPADRFSTASAFADALADPGFTVPATVAMPAQPIAEPERARGRFGVLAAAVIVALAGGLTVGRMTAPAPSETVARFTLPVPEGVTAVSRCCGPTQALSPDGEWLVFVGLGGGEGRSPLYRRRLGQLEAEEIPNTDDGSIPFFSPDGAWLGFYSDGRLRKVPMAGGPSVPIAEIQRVEGASWGDDDVIVLSMNDGPLYTVPASGGDPVAVPNTEDGNYVHPWVLPGAEAVLARMNGPEANADEQVAVVDLTTGEADVLAVATRIAYASGYLVMSTVDGTLLAQPFDVKKRQRTGQAVAILDDVGVAGPAIGEYAVSMEGGLAYQARGGASDEALVILGQGDPVEIPLSEGGDLEGPTFSPDGR